LIKISIAQASRVIGGRLGGNLAEAAVDAAVTGVSINTRTLSRGELFFALEGPTFDGHDFLKDASTRGAVGAVVRALPDESPIPLVLVGDPAQALVTLAGWVRDTVDPLVVGVTGSTGKTGVKDFLASILTGRTPVVASRGSLNNDLGVPLTLLESDFGTEVVVCEMGARGMGQIARLCRYARPSVGVVTNVGLTHYEQFGSQEAIASAKSELVRSLPASGAAVLNADDPLVCQMADATTAHVKTFGDSPSADLRANDVRFDGHGRASFTMIDRDSAGAVWVSLGVSGIHQVSNALAASSAALALGLDLEACAIGLGNAAPSPWRMDMRTENGVRFVNDAYNASPTSMESALKTCRMMVEGPNKLVAVLGCMAELGEISEVQHEKIGRLAATLAQQLVVVGSGAASIAAGARSAGMTAVSEVPDIKAAALAIDALDAGDVLLVKGSRSAGLEGLTDLVLAGTGNLARP